MGNESDLKEAIITRYLLGIFSISSGSGIGVITGKITQKLSTNFRKRQTKFGREKSHYHTIT
jgi:hypothetical protein